MCECVCVCVWPPGGGVGGGGGGLLVQSCQVLNGVLDAAAFFL